MFIDTTELVLGALGVASSIYDPWVGNPFAPVFVMLARAAGVTSLFLCAGLGVLSMAAQSELDFDPTNLAVKFFAAGAAAPINARGARSLIDMGTMFNDLIFDSYTEKEEKSGATRQCNVGNDANKVKIFFEWTFAVFINLMDHSVSFNKLAPYSKDLFLALGNNIDKLIHRDAIYWQNQPQDIWCWDKKSWGERLEAPLNLVILNALGVGFLILQAFATPGEGLLLAVGSI